MLLDDAPVYNAFHLFGFLSTFNTDALKHVEIIKGGFPARYGGRLSSVVNIQMKDGNRQAIRGVAGVGLLSSRLTLEGPLFNAKSSFLISGRRSYADLITGLLIPKSKRPYLNFGDLNLKFSYEPNSRHRFSLSSYQGRDNFSFSYGTGDDRSYSGMRWGNQTITFRWQQVVHPKLFANTALIYSRYQFRVFEERKSGPDTFYQEYASGIRNYSVKSELDWYATANYSLKAGFQLTNHLFTPRAFTLKNTQRDSLNIQETLYRANELAAFMEHEWKPLPVLSMNAGLRWAGFFIDRHQYANLEPRFSVGWQAHSQWSLKASYARTYQFMHLLSNSGIGLPTDLWVPATDSIPPQQAQQFALGLAHEHKSSPISLEIEAFYKPMQDILAYKDGASFLLFNMGSDPEGLSTVEWQQNVTSGKGLAYGGEFFLQKSQGRLRGWIAYTLNWTRHQFATINEGNWFYARYDRRHDLKIVSSYKLSDKIALSATWVYGSGQAITLPLYVYRMSEFNVTGYQAEIGIKQYSNRNQYRAAPYHRLDLGVQFRKEKRRTTRTWEINVYNAYSRVNPFYYNVGSRYQAGGAQNYLYYVGLFPIVPSLSYQLAF